MRKLRTGAWACILMVVVFVPGALAQQPTQSQQPQDQPTQPTQPIQAYHSPLAILGGNGSEETPEDLSPDTRPLSGVQDFSLGFPVARRSFWQPYFNFNVTADSNPLGAASSTGWVAYSSILGGIDLHKFSGRSDLTLSYVGGGSFSNESSVGDFITQQFELAEIISFRRVTLSLFDQFDYIPEAGFGYGGLSNLLSPEGGSIGLQNDFLFGQTILTARGQRAANTSLAEVDTLLSPRSSLTFAGGYSFLQFFDNDLLNSGDIIFQAGYNRQIGPENTVAIFYRFNGYRYGGSDQSGGSIQSINDNSVYLSYGRRLTGRLALRVAAGPEFAFIETPITGIPPAGSAAADGTSTAANQTLITWSASASLAYALSRTSFSLAYNRGVGNGSGVLAGAISDTVRGSVDRQFSRTFRGNLNFGYSRNTGLAEATASTPESGAQTYDYWFGSLGLTHPFGRSANCFVTYQTQYQTSNSTFCIGPTCATNVVRQTISVGLNWRAHPVAF
jgi:hypothetical protein